MMCNNQPAVYDVLETTGFTAMMPISKVLREISIENCEQIGKRRSRNEGNQSTAAGRNIADTWTGERKIWLRILI